VEQYEVKAVEHCVKNGVAHDEVNGWAHVI
jgi:hypothetical protein